MDRILLSRNNGKRIELAKVKVPYRVITFITTAISYLIIKILIVNEVLPSGIERIPGIVTIYSILAFFTYKLTVLVNTLLFPDEIIIEDGKAIVRVLFTNLTLQSNEIIVDYSDNDVLDNAKYNYYVEDPAVIILHSNNNELKLVVEKEELKNLIFEPKTLQ